MEEFFGLLIMGKANQHTKLKDVYASLEVKEIVGELSVAVV